MSVSLFVCFSVYLSVKVCQSACPPNCVSVLSATVLVTQSAVIDLQFYVNQFFFCHQGKASLYSCGLPDCSLFCRSVSPSIRAKCMPVYSLYNYGSCLPLSFYQSVPTARVSLQFDCDSFTSWCLHFFVVRNVLIITDTVIVRVVISRIFLFVKSKFTSPGCVKMRNPDLNFHHWISLSKTIQSNQSTVSQASKPTISTFLIVNKLKYLSATKQICWSQK